MKLRILIYLSLAIGLSLGACNSAEKKLAEKTVSDFFVSLKKDDSVAISKVFPDFKKLSWTFKTDTATITSSSISGNVVTVKVHTSWTNGEKKMFEHDMSLDVQVENEKAVIKSSTGLSSHKTSEVYRFAVATGCIDSNQKKTDIEIADLMTEAVDLYGYERALLIEQLRKEVLLQDLQWKPAFGIGSGSAVIKNNSPFPVYFLRYRLSFIGFDRHILGAEDGFVSRDTIASKGEKKFDIVAIQPEGVASVDVQLIFENIFLRSTMEKKAWTGKEYAEWKKSKSKS